MSSTITLTSRRNDNTTLVLALGLLASVGLHLGGLLWASVQKARVHEVIRPVELELVEIKPPPPPPPPKEEEPPKPKVKPPQIKADVKPPPVAEPPPPNEEVKEPPKPPVLVVGIQMSSTVSNGAYAAPVGNTAYGKVADKAVAPSSVQNYGAPKYVPPGNADHDPEVAEDFKPPYPKEARTAGIEGTVRLKIVVDIEGRVVHVEVLDGPGFGLNEAAREGIKRIKFKPAMKGGEAVSTSLVYNFTFLLD